MCSLVGHERHFPDQSRAGGCGPRHPYARGLLDALPERAFRPVPGRPPELAALPEGCAFAARCAHADTACTAQPPLTGGLGCHHPHTAPADLVHPPQAVEAPGA